MGADTLFHHRNYLQAMHSYEKAGLPRQKRVAHAYFLRDQASSSHTDGFKQAAVAFESSAKEATSDREKNAYYRTAAQCSISAGDHAQAARAYSHAGEFTSSAYHYRLAGMFDKAIKVVNRHKTLVDRHVADAIFNVSKVYYLREHKIA